MLKATLEKSSRHDLVAECAKLFYKEKLAKNKVAERLSVSPMQVTRLIREAEKRGIVHVLIRGPRHREELQKSLVESWKLQKATVVDFCEDYGELKRRLGRAAAAVFEDEVNLRVTPTVGIGGGSTIHELVESVDAKSRSVTIYSTAMFGRGPDVTYFDSAYVATYLYLKCRPAAKAYIVGVPPLPSRRETAKRFSKMLYESIPEVADVVDGARRVDVAFVGLGAFLPFDEIVRSMAKAGLTADVLKSRKVAGGINYNYFDANGRQIGDYLLTVRVDDLRRLSADASKLVCLVAGGQHKISAIRTALQSKMVNALVTDSKSAEELMTADEKVELDESNGEEATNEKR